MQKPEINQPEEKYNPGSKTPLHPSIQSWLKDPPTSFRSTTLCTHPPRLLGVLQPPTTWAPQMVSLGDWYFYISDSIIIVLLQTVTNIC
jgi:hypothetical protein